MLLCKLLALLRRHRTPVLRTVNQLDNTAPRQPTKPPSFMHAWDTLLCTRKEDPWSESCYRRKLALAFLMRLHHHSCSHKPAVHCHCTASRAAQSISMGAAALGLHYGCNVAGRTVRSLLLPMSMIVMLGLACCLASSSQLARWLKVSRLAPSAQQTRQT